MALSRVLDTWRSSSRGSGVGVSGRVDCGVESLPKLVLQVLHVSVRVDRDRLPLAVPAGDCCEPDPLDPHPMLAMRAS